MKAIQAFPLAWPDGWQRTDSWAHKEARFSKKSRGNFGGKPLTISDAVIRIRTELKAMRLDDDDIVISSNLKLRLDGYPMSGQPEPSDSGACVYWRDGKEMRCMAIDVYTRVADNLAAIAATLNAMRAIERHGGAEILNRAFTGFTALPLHGEPWWEVLGLDKSARGLAVTAQYRILRSLHHPDNNGDAEKFHKVQMAYETACAQGVI